MFRNVLKVLGYRLQYEAAVGYAGNSFCEKSSEMIDDTNPMNMLSGRTKQKKDATLLSFLESADVKIGHPVIKGKN